MTTSHPCKAPRTSHVCRARFFFLQNFTDSKLILNFLNFFLILCTKSLKTIIKNFFLNFYILSKSAVISTSSNLCQSPRKSEGVWALFPPLIFQYWNMNFFNFFIFSTLHHYFIPISVDQSLKNKQNGF